MEKKLSTSEGRVFDPRLPPADLPPNSAGGSSPRSPLYAHAPPLFDKS